MSFLKDVKAKVPRSNKAGLQALKTLAVATYTRHQRAQRLREQERPVAEEEGGARIGEPAARAVRRSYHILIISRRANGTA